MGDGKHTRIGTYTQIEYNSSHTEADVPSEVHWLNESK